MFEFFKEKAAESCLEDRAQSIECLNQSIAENEQNVVLTRGETKVKSIVDNMRDCILTEEDKKELSRDEIQKIEEAFAITISASNRKQYKKYNKLLKQYSNSCYYYSRQHQRKADLYTALRNMAESDPAKLLRIWDEIVKTGQLKHSDDIEEVFTLLDVTDCIQVYNDVYEVKRCYDSIIDFELYGRNLH